MKQLNLTKSNQLWEEALDLIPGGVIGIRRPVNFVPGEYPVFMASGKGGRIKDVDGNSYIDLLCAFGPIILGHSEERVDAAVTEQIKKGFCFNLAQVWQNKLAKKMRALIPCAEQSMFMKTGSEATNAAVRIARAYSGKLKILRCGYHGWGDWCVEVKGGVPEKLYEDTHEFHYNDLKGVEKLLSEHKGNVAGIIVTPVGHPLAHPLEEPKPGFLEGLRKLADEHSVVLIFDEVRTGFRVSLGGAQLKYGVTPDIALFGKAMANGYPVSAVCGKKKFLQPIADGKVFISSTFFPNSLEMVAALKTIEIMETENVLDAIWEKGKAFLDDLRIIASETNAPVTISGIPPMPCITFNKDSEGKYKNLRPEFYRQCIRRGLFMHPFHHSYIAYRHTADDLERALEVIREGFKCRSVGV
ncbi:MAG: aminotransferase class III-fold pyridoxal phosphate-dependent enzyme [Pseudomonadota bacterium]